MAIKPILLLGNPILRQQSENITFPLSAEDKLLLQDLCDTLHEFQHQNGFGRGIAAPQIGILKKAICIDMGTPKFFINPSILAYNTPDFEMFDDCFSMPEIMIWLKRSSSIIVEYYDEKGNCHQQYFDGDWAELLQHEIDHLFGKMAIDRVGSIKDIWSRREWQRKQNN